VAAWTSRHLTWGKVAYRAIKTVPARSVTWPFSALASFFGGSGDEFGDDISHGRREAADQGGL